MMYSFDFPLKEPCDFEKIDSHEDKYYKNWDALSVENKKSRKILIWPLIICAICLIGSFIFFSIALSMSLEDVFCAEEPETVSVSEVQTLATVSAQKTSVMNEKIKPVLLADKDDCKAAFDIYLDNNDHIKSMYETFVKEVDDEGKRVFSDEFIVGLIANIESEGTPGVVESAFSIYGAYEFELPSEGKVIKTKEDVEYLLNWTTERCREEDESVCKGSCGVSSIQWSYERRLKWLKLLQNEIANKKPINQDTFLEVDRQMILLELKKDGKYYNKVIDNLPEDPSVEDYAEALCDFYVCPSHSCGRMKGSGEACIKRRERAKELWNMKAEMITNDVSVQ